MYQSRKLLSLLVATTGACAASQPPVATPVASRAAARAPVATATDIKASVAADPLQQAVVSPVIVEGIVLPVTPLLQANGRPACGNIQTKGGPEADRAMLVQERANLVARLHAPQYHAYAEHVRLAKLDLCLGETPS